MKKYILIILIFIGMFSSITTAFSEDCTEEFSWLPNSESDVVGYKIYYGLSGGGPYSDSINITAPVIVDGLIKVSVPNLICGEHYYFVCVAYNTAGVESEFSEQVDFVVTGSSSTDGTITKIFGSATGADYTETIQDTFININTDNNESNVQLSTYTWPENMVANAIILKIDLSLLPQNAQVQNASLQLYETEAGGDEIYDISVHRIINHNPNLFTATGYTYDGSNSWTANTACYNNIPLAQADVSAATVTTSIDLSSGYKSWDITEIVNDWRDGSTSNFGLLLNSDSTASADSYRIFASTEASSDQRPRLVITYTAEGTTLPQPTGFKLLN